MEEKFKESFKQASAFQKMWMDSMSGMTRIWNDYSPQNPPPEELKKVRNGVLKAISQTWEEYMRTPEFMSAMRDPMNNSNQWQKWAKENANKVHSAMGSSTKDDIQGIMVALQHVERRVLDGLDEMQGKLASMQKDVDSIQKEGTKTLEKYQLQVMERLAGIEQSMKALHSVPSPAVAKPAPVEKEPVKTAAPVTKAAPTGKVAPAKKTAAKKAVAKAANPKTPKANKK
jgi:TolA-binding protein